MACIGGILMYVAFNMVKAGEVREVIRHNRIHVALMLYTAVMVIVTDFLTGVLSAIVLYAALKRFLDSPALSPDTTIPPVEELAGSYGQLAAQYDRPNGQNGRAAAEHSGDRAATRTK